MTRVIPNTNDLQTKHPELVYEWDIVKNGSVLPNSVSSNSHIKYWWKCEKGHCWQASPYNRSNGTGCPYCAGKIPIRGYNDLATTSPEILNEWDYEKNSPDTPETVFGKSGKLFWWKCKNNHSWQAKPNERSQGNGCPYCSGHRVWEGFNDLATLEPEIAVEWNYEKNPNLSPDQITVSSNKKVWWKCKEGHEWQEKPTNRIKGYGCPYCSGHRVWKGYNDLATLRPEIVVEWNYEKNPNLAPDQITVSSSKKVWWKCEKGHEWPATVSHRLLSGTGCPYCIGRYVVVGKTDLATMNPPLAKEWHPTKNGEISPHEVTSRTPKKYWWLCPICNHSWQASPSVRDSKGSGCPECYKRNQTSFPEQAIFYYIKQVFPDAFNSYTEPFDNGMELDIYIPSKRIGIEYDGYRHKGKKADAVKYDICKKNSIYLIRVSEIAREDINSLCDEFIISRYSRFHFEGLDFTLSQLFASLKIESIDYNTSRDRMRIYEQYLSRLKENSLSQKFPTLASEWNRSKNGTLLPEMFNWGAGDKVWWKCSCGYEWQATIASRTSGGGGCPICAKKRTKAGQIEARLLAGQKTLFDIHPELELEWDYEKNQSFDTSMILPHCNEKAWWKCKKAGHEWYASISSRSYGTGCPYCSGNLVTAGITDLATTRPEIAKLWNYKMNKELTPQQVSQYSNKKVWWICEKGHQWNAPINSITGGRRCPYCSGKKVLKGFNDLESLRPDLMEEWNYDKNVISPSEVSEHSGKKSMVEMQALWL